MSSKYILYSDFLSKIRPLSFSNEAIVLRYQQIKQILIEKVDTNFVNLLAEPQIPAGGLEGKEKIHWQSNFQAIPFSQLNENQKENVRNKLGNIFNKIKNVAQSLKNSSDLVSQQAGELLLLASNIPNKNSIYSDGENIVLINWGMESEDNNQENFKLELFINGTRQNTPPPQNNQNTNNNSSARKVLISASIALFIILCGLVYFMFFHNKKTILPKKEGIVAPIEPQKIISNPNDPLKRKIVSDRLNVIIKPNYSIKEFAEKFVDEHKEDAKVIYWNERLRQLQFELKEKSLKEWKEVLKKHEEVENVFCESILEKAKIIPSDPDFTNKRISWYFETIGAYKAWETTMGNPTIIVAIIDNCFDLSHPEFKDKIVMQHNSSENSNNIYVTRGSGNFHGTHVAGSAIALHNNKKGISGIAPNCKFMPLQAADVNGNLSGAAINEAILYAIDHGAKIINMSLGMSFPKNIKNAPESQQKKWEKTEYVFEAKQFDRLAKFAVEKGVLIVKAAGNDNVLAGLDAQNRSDNILTVAALSPKDKKAGFSNYGDYTDISAPGEQIYSSLPNGKFGFLQGTSMASPIVAGAAALLLSANPSLKPLEIKNLLLTTGKNINGTSKQKVGVLMQLDKAMEKAGTNISCDEEVERLKKEIERLKKAQSTKH